MNEQVLFKPYDYKTANAKRPTVVHPPLKTLLFKGFPF